jgi:hypothetical protein
MSAEPGGRFRAILGFSLLLLCSSALVAQPVPSGTPVQEPAVASWPRIAGGTLGGGMLGAGVLGGAGFLLGRSSSDDGSFVSASEAFAVLGAAAGYTIGAAVGARLAAATAGREPRLGGILLASVAGAAAGGLLWNRIGETFESAEGSRVDSWTAGAAAGLATHVLITSVAARHAARKARPGTERR